MPIFRRAYQTPSPTLISVYLCFSSILCSCCLGSHFVRLLCSAVSSLSFLCYSTHSLAVVCWHCSCSCVCDYIDLMVSNHQITLVQFKFTESVAHFFHSLAFLYIFFLCCFPAEKLFAKDLCRFLMRVFRIV